MGPSLLVLATSVLGAASVSVAEGTPCLDRTTLSDRLAADATQAELDVQVRREGDALVVEGRRAKQAKLVRRIPLQEADCAALERVVVALVHSWVRTPVPVLRASAADAGVGRASPAGVAVVPPASEAGVAAPGSRAGAPESAGDGAGPAADGAVWSPAATRPGAPAAAVATTSGAAGTAPGAPPAGSADGRAASVSSTRTPVPRPGQASAPSAPGGAGARDFTETPGASPSVGSAAPNASVGAAAGFPAGSPATGSGGAGALVGAPARSAAETPSTAGAAPNAPVGAAAVAPPERPGTGGAAPAATVASSSTGGRAPERSSAPVAAASPSDPVAAPSSEGPTSVSATAAVPSSRTPWSLGIAVLGGAAAGPTPQPTAVGSLVLTALRGWWGMALEVGLESGRSESVSPGTVWASTQWVSLGPAVAFTLAPGWRLDAWLAFRVTHIAAGAQGYPASSSASLFGLGAVLSGGASRRLNGPLWLEARLFVSVRAPAERLVITNAPGALELGAWQAGGLLGLRLDFPLERQ